MEVIVLIESAELDSRKSVQYVAMNPQKEENVNLHLIGLPLGFNQHHKLPPHVKRTCKIRAAIRESYLNFMTFFLQLYWIFGKVVTKRNSNGDPT
ncbi:hypothetical protein AVEN_195113-1 [Araneus ventricosus]|uniref:Uncharacterized protein n=1 Tax=Araneus ventricosus TaxID=182803 RepID=A0A4Y2BG30_ARAVE|nr:hypothetical protein AVEN_195113-1 [Araneus ventricosus]